MISLVEQRKDALADLCRRYRVRRLYVFGSAAEDRFDPERSDLDFLVKMAGREPSGSYADRVLELADALQRLFQRRVDLITEESMRNPYFRREVEATRQLVYEEPDQEAAA
jgi:predicted nucleotidyltransferase